VESWYNKAEFNAQALETYASATESNNKQLVAVLQQGSLVASDAKVRATNLNGIYVERADEFAPKTPKQQLNKASSSSLKGFTRKAISFDLKSAGTAIVTILNSDGAEVATLRAENAQPGFNTLRWNGENIPSGRYLVRIDHNGSVSGKNAVLK
jgi:flagellar hook assembly protein FlgD